MKHESARALDPKLVPLFIELLPSFAAELGAEGQPVEELAPVDELPGSTAVGLVPTAAANAFENIALAHREIYALYEIAQSMGTSLGVSDTMALISSKLSKVVSWSGCSLFLHQPESDSLKCRFAAGVDAPRLLNTTLKVGHGLSGWVARNRRTLINGNPHVSFDAVGLSGDLAVKSAIVCPLQYNDTFIGCLSLYHVQPNYYTEDHRRLLERIAEKSEVAIIVMDIDGFKTINDTYGHNVGDHALREVASALQAALRPYDLCVRYAGDEFIVVLADCSRDVADLKRHELQSLIAEIQVDVRAGKRLRLGASAGVAVFPHDGATYEQLLADADHLMYRDKAARRGHVPLPAAIGGGEFIATDMIDPSVPLQPSVPLSRFAS